MTEFRAINLDMDGTFVDLYGVENWLKDILNRDTRPYEVARPLVNLSALARVLNNKQRKGYQINIVSWTAKNAPEEYNIRVTNAKREWLAKHLPNVNFDNIYIVAYGTPNHKVTNGYLFDDEEPNRKAWGKGAQDANDLIEKIKKIA